MHPIKLHPVLPGSTVGLIAPASSVNPEAMAPGLAMLEKLGYDYKFGTHELSKNKLTSASPEQRLADIYELLEDNEIQAIWAIRGGYGTMQLLDLLDYGVLRDQRKLLIGFSDVTALQWAIYSKTKLATLSGLTLTLQLREENSYLSTAVDLLSGSKTRIISDNLLPEKLTIYQNGVAEGVLLGGTLSMICAICGTPYFPPDNDVILFIEDIDEPLYRIDRLLRQLHLCGFLHKIRGLILGKFLEAGNQHDIYPLIKTLLPSGTPVVGNFPYGHLTDSIAMPVGVQATLSTDPFTLEWKPFMENTIA